MILFPGRGESRSETDSNAAGALESGGRYRRFITGKDYPIDGGFFNLHG
jgi:hypothetical protein